MRDILSKIFNSVVVSDSDFFRDGLHLSLLSVLHLLDLSGDSLNLGLVLVFDDLLFEGDVFDSALSLDDFLASVDCGANNSSNSIVGGGGSIVAGACSNGVGVGGRDVCGSGHFIQDWSNGQSCFSVNKLAV